MECRDSPREVAKADAVEAGRRDKAGELFLSRKSADAFNQITIGVLLARHEPAERRKDGEGILIIELTQHGQRHVAELEAQESPAWAQNPPRLAQRPIEMRHVPQSEGDGAGIDAHVGQRQRFRVSANPGDAIEEAAIDRAVASDLDHLAVDVADHDFGRIPPIRPMCQPGVNAKCDVASAARDVQEPYPGLRRQCIDKRRLPQPVDTRGHEVVHQVITLSDAFEHGAHEVRLLEFRDLFEPEIRLAAVSFFVRIVSHGRTIA